jgi:hypothetical protein
MSKLALTIQSGRSGLKVALVAACTAAALAMSIIPASATTVAHLVFTPAPIGTVNTLAAGTTVVVSLTAKDSSSLPVPGVAVFVSFLQAPGGGTAFVGTTGLGTRIQAFVTDSLGRVLISYSTPAVYPAASNTVDAIHAQNGATRALSTIVADTSFSFSPITALVFTPTPIARLGSLGPSHKVTITLTVFGPGGVRLANGTVDVAFKQAAGGGTASSNGLTLGKTPSVLTTNGSGQILITFTTPATLPTVVEADKLIASDAPKFAVISALDAYRY